MSNEVLNIKYSKLIDDINSYDTYKRKLISLKESKQYNKKLFKQMIDFNFDKFDLLLKILSLPLAITIIINVAFLIIDSIFNTELEDLFQELLINSTISSFIYIFTTLGIVLMTKIYKFRKEYIYIKYALYVSLISCFIYENINHEFKYIIITFALLFNIFVFLKYKTEIFKFHSIPLPYNKTFVLTHIKEIKKIKCNNDDYIDIRIRDYNKFKDIRNITILFIFIFIIGSIFIVYLQKLNALYGLVILFIIYYTFLTGYIMRDVDNYIMTLKNIEKGL